ncbi:MAG TPA: leucine--tRNA ligase, partial [Candidatus Paceibacterota bacterium]|nr:leucine--tRNA ligase [Candidatus Paceibacterota bacterium]
KKWQKFWQAKKIYQTLSSGPAKAKKLKPFYVLDMFPYPSGSGLHVGHPRGYIGSDVYARMKRMEGCNVLHPMGYDAFGLPAEQYAIEHKVHPKEAVKRNVTTFKKQLSIIGLSYDWSRKINTTDPEYYKWTQWIFLKLYNHYYDSEQKKARPIKDLIKKFEKENHNWKKLSALEKQEVLMKYRLAYEGEAEVNWCPGLGTVLANDEVTEGQDGHLVSERGGHPVEKIKIKQWFLRITAYADRLLSGLEELKWPSHLKEIEKNWIGRSEGSEIEFPIKNSEEKIKVFTTRVDTLFGATYMVLAPEHALISKLKIENWKEAEEYINKARHKTAKERTNAEKEKTGVALKGVKAINPASGEEILIFISDYVLADYGTGAIMAVPAHDSRDYIFAKKFGLSIRKVVEQGTLINSGKFSGLSSEEARKKITEFVNGKIVIKYKMRDAVFARQRYWGEPIPLWRDREGILHEVEKLPLKLPNVKSYEPTGKAEGPLAGVRAWTEKGFETNTMPGWAGSSWYFLRYMDPKNKKELAGKKELEYWKAVDVYVGGAEHATGHLLYARFWHKFLRDLGIAPAEEPFLELHNQGLILAADGRKMSKRWGNVVNPDDIIATYGADTLRVYEMFMGPFTDSIAWSTESIIGARRFLERVWRIAEKVIKEKAKETGETEKRILHKTIKKISNDIKSFNFNTAISAMMICASVWEKGTVTISDLKLLLQILSPFAPHITEEIWLAAGEKKSINLSAWPKWSEELAKDTVFKIAIQVNGKVRDEMEIAADLSEEEVKKLALSQEAISKWLTGPAKKIIYVKNKLVNIVV